MKFHRVDVLAARFGVTSQTIRNWIRSGRLPALQPGGRLYLVDDRDVAVFERQTVATARNAA